MTVPQAQKPAHTPGEMHAGGWSSNGTPLLLPGDYHAFHAGKVYTPSYGHGYWLATAEEAVAEAKANARLITAAWNSYDKHFGPRAVEAAEADLLGAALAEIAVLADIASEYAASCAERGAGSLAGEIAAEVHAARAVLSKAQGVKP